MSRTRGEVVDDGAVGEVQLAHGGRVHLEGQAAGDGVPPQHGQDLHLVGLEGRQGRPAAPPCPR